MGGNNGDLPEMTSGLISWPVGSDDWRLQSSVPSFTRKLAKANLRLCSRSTKGDHLTVWKFNGTQAELEEVLEDLGLPPTGFLLR